jgi:hypothetical protein
MNNKEKKKGNERLKIYYHGKTAIIQRDVFVSAEISKIYLLWSIYPQPRINQGSTVTCIYKYELRR